MTGTSCDDEDSVGRHAQALAVDRGGGGGLSRLAARAYTDRETENE